MRRATPYLIVFIDLTRFKVQAQQTDDLVLADGLDAYYLAVGAAVAAAGGIVVKTIGDAMLLVFPEDAVDRGVTALLDLKPDVDRLFSERGWECRLMIKAHFGTAVAGPFGGTAEPRFDVIGKDVNTAALLPSGPLTLSADAFEKLGSGMRTRFTKHAPPVAYMRTESPHREETR